MSSRVVRKAAIIALHNMTYSSRVFKQADALHAAGFDVTLVGIVARSSDLHREEHDFGRIVRVRTTKNLHTERMATEGSSGGQPEPSPSFLAGVRMALRRLRENYLLAKAAIATHPDVVVASDLTAWAAGYWVSRRAKTPLMLDARDLVFDSGREHPAVYDWMLRRLERFAIQRADAVTTVSPQFAAILTARYPKAPAVVAIYSGAFECVKEPQPIHSPLRLFFQGNFVPNRRIDELIRAVAGLGDVDVTLSLQGFGAEEERLRLLVLDLNAEERIEFVPRCDARDVVKCASNYDVGVINYRGDTLNLSVSAPIKLLDYMGAGLAVLASDLPGIREIVEKEGCGVLFEPTGPGAIADTIRKLVQDIDAVAEMKANSVRACPQYSAREQGRRFAEVVDSVLADRKSMGGQSS